MKKKNVRMSTANVYLDFIGATPQNQKCWRIFSSKMKREMNTFSNGELNRDQVNSMVKWTIFENENKKLCVPYYCLNFASHFFCVRSLLSKSRTKADF